MWWTTALLLGVAVIGVVALTVGTATGRLSIQTVPTGSMEPAIHQGSAIVVDPIPVSDIVVGDVIVFAAPETGRMTVHRVVEVDDDDGLRTFTTKGDANQGPDPWRLLPDEDHLHRVRFAVPGVGRALLALSAPWTRMALAVVGGLAVLGFGLSHIWRRSGHGEGATATWEATLERLVEGVHHPLGSHPRDLLHRGAASRRSHDEHDRGAGADEAVSMADAVDAARARATDPLAALLADHPTPPDSDEGQATDGPGRAKGKGVGGMVAVVVVAVVLAGAVAWFPPRAASASLTAATSAANSIVSLTVAPKGAVDCAWTSTTALTMAWTNPNATDTGQVLVATSPGGTPTVGASAAAGETSATYAPSPVTTVKYVSARAVHGTWTSTASPTTATNLCRGAIRASVGGTSSGFAGDGGAATSASLKAPYQSAEAPDGRIFVADSANNRIRVVAADGTISTFAGGTGAASACAFTGPVGSLRMNKPRGVAVDGSGNVYIADTGASCIRKVDTGGTVTRFAGGGSTTACNTAVAPTNLSLSNPSGLAVAPDGTVIVADTGRSCIRRLTATTTSLVAGGGSTSSCGSTTATGVSLSQPIGVAVDDTGAIYIADTGRNCIRKVSGTTVTAVMGGGNTTSCTGSTAPTSVRLASPEGVAVASSGTIYVADTGRRCVRQLSGGTATPVAFTGTNSSAGDDGPALAATIRTPAMLTVLADGDVLVSDRATNTGASDVRRIELS